MSDTANPIVGIAAVAIDSAQPEPLARFWQTLLGGEIAVDEVGDAELHSGTVRLDFIRVPDRKTTKNRLHLDLHPSDLEAAVRHALAAGATLADDVYSEGSWRVLRDPEGNEFCILQPRRSEAAATRSPGS